ncbi:hypothetical protein [Elioraea rosea]|uniref:hypothetical protein n=1 Tax=Elioraea rosea TaxID=2492390 RepID=UPI0011823C24|nr:hypothetical protein [Elioraea rosea]
MERALQGLVVAGSDRRVAIGGEIRQVSAILPGEGWCEVTGVLGSSIRQFVHMPPRVEWQRANRDASSFDMHFEIVELAFLPPPAGSATYLPIEPVRARFADALHGGGGPGTGLGSGLTAPVRRGAKADVGLVDPATGCLPVSMDGDMPVPNETPRRFEMRSRVCVTQAGVDAAATLQLLQEWTPCSPGKSERVQAYRGTAERLFASMRLGGAP